MREDCRPNNASKTPCERIAGQATSSQRVYWGAGIGVQPTPGHVWSGSLSSKCRTTAFRSCGSPLSHEGIVWRCICRRRKRAGQHVEGTSCASCTRSLSVVCSLVDKKKSILWTISSLLNLKRKGETLTGPCLPLLFFEIAHLFPFSVRKRRHGNDGAKGSARLSYP